MSPSPTHSYEALLQRAGFGLFSAGHDGGFLDANAALARMLGFEAPAELFTVDLRRDVFLEPAEFDRLLSNAISSTGPDWAETRWKKHDGSTIIVRMTLRAVRRPDASIVIEGVAEDVTDRRRQEELLRRSERLASLGTTLAGVAHELNNPLAAVMGFAQLLLKRDWPEEDRTALETISHEAERSAKIVKELLSLARQREADRRASVDLNDVVGYIVRTRRYALETSGITCELRLDPLLPPISGDRAQLEQVVLNLVSNAEQALHRRVAADGRQEEERRIRVRTRCEETMAVLEVEDNGPGIPENAQGHIWDPFFTTGIEGEGTGLGLSVVNHIVTEHGGDVAVDSATTSGVRFTVRLPRPGDTDVAVARAEAAHAERALDLLVVAADAADLRFLTHFLTSRGHAVLAASDAERAHRFCSQTTFDAVVLDLASKDETPHVMTRLRASGGCDGTRFIVAAATDGDASGAESLPPGVVQLQKPYDVEQLRRAVETA